MPVEILAALIGAIGAIVAAIIATIVTINKNKKSEATQTNTSTDKNRDYNVEIKRTLNVVSAGNIIGNDNIIGDNNKVFVEQKSEADLKIVDSRFEENEGFFIDIKLRNSGDKTAFITKIEFKIYDYYEMINPQITQYCLVEPTAVYDVILSGEKNQAFALSQAVNGNNVDRFKIRVANSLSEARMPTIYYFSYVLHYNEDDRKVESQKYIAAIPSMLNWAGCFVADFSYKNAKHNYIKLDQISKYKCKKSKGFLMILNSYEKHKNEFLNSD